MSESQGEKRLDYRGKMILAPMVKIGTLPTRLLALDYGADIVYTEELIDWRLLNSTRVVNDVLDTVDYIDNSDNSLVFRTCARERGHLVLQMGTSNGDRAAVVAKKLEQDIDGIDVNMGCPKSFSLKGGMGAALLTQPDKIVDILTKIKRAVNIPVTCKIRLLPCMEKTLELVRTIEATGVSALAVHGRTKEQRQNDPNNVEAIRRIVETVSIPVIANGGSSNNRNSEANTHQGIKKFWEESRAASVMVARAAEWNPSVFRPGEKEDIMVVIHKYLLLAIQYDYPFTMVKYCVQQFMGSLQDTPQGREFLESPTMGDLCRVFHLEGAYRARQAALGATEARPDYAHCLRMKKEAEVGPARKRKIGDIEVVEMFRPFVRGHFDQDNSGVLPKTRLLNFTRRQMWEPPKYQVMQEDKRFKAIVSLEGKGAYSSGSWEKNKRYAEQAAALVAIACLGLDETESDSSTTEARNGITASVGFEEAERDALATKAINPGGSSAIVASNGITSSCISFEKAMGDGNAAVDNKGIIFSSESSATDASASKDCINNSESHSVQSLSISNNCGHLDKENCTDIYGRLEQHS